MTELMNADAEPRLLIVAESLLSRAGLAALLEERGCKVLGQADGAGLRREIERLEPDLLIVDFGWETEALRDQLIPLDKDIPVLALVQDDEAALAPVLGALSVWFWIIMVLFPMSKRKPYGTGSPPSRHNDGGNPPSNPE